MQRAGQRAALGALMSLAEIDQQDVGLADPGNRLARRQRKAGITTSISLGFGSFRLFISSTYSSIERT